MRNKLQIATAAALAATLAGCGAGGGAQQTQQSADASQYAAYAAYCGEKDATTGASGFSVTLYRTVWPGQYEVTSFHTDSGANDTSAPPLYLTVHLDTGAVIEPDMGMGVVIPAVAPARAVGCVAQLLKSGGTSAWKSTWPGAPTIASLPGTLVNGFEFPVNFTPAGGIAQFVLPKSRYPTSAGLSICYGAPTGGSWSCSAPTVSETADAWSLRVSNPRAGVYVLVRA